MFKKYATYIAILILGIVLGKFFLVTSDTTKAIISENSSAQETQYTCSMHPQVLQPGLGDCPLCGMALITSDNSGTIIVQQHQFKMTENAMALANIETTTVGLDTGSKSTMVLSGKITPNERTNAVQTSIFDGRIEKLNINYIGQYVKKGQQLGTIYAPEMYLAQDKLLTSASYKETHQKLFDAARNTFGLWKMTDAQIEEVLKTEKPMMNFPIYADVSGTVTEIIASQGDFYKEGDPLFKLSNLYTVWAVFDVYETQISKLKVGQSVAMTSNAFKGKTLQAKISFIEPILDESKRTVSVRVTLNNKNGLLKPGIFVEGQVQILNEGETLTIPKSAVLWTGKRSLVYLKPNAEMPVFEMTEVVLGDAIGNSYEILKGLSSGDNVVTNGTFTVDAAAQLQGKKSMMSGKDVQHKLPKLENEKIEIHLDTDFKNESAKVIAAYMDLKDALIATDSKKSVEKADELIQEIKRIDNDLQSEDVVKQIKSIETSSETISKNTNIKTQRKAFKILSENMITILSGLKDLDRPIYVQHCPMAVNTTGANWLSWEEKVLNPYFGNMMLTCGSVIEKID